MTIPLERMDVGKCYLTSDQRVVQVMQFLSSGYVTRERLRTGTRRSWSCAPASAVSPSAALGSLPACSAAPPFCRASPNAWSAACGPMCLRGLTAFP